MYKGDRGARRTGHYGPLPSAMDNLRSLRRIREGDAPTVFVSDACAYEPNTPAGVEQVARRPA